MIISAIIVFETRPQRDERVGVICNNCSYDVNEKPSYTDKLLDPVSIFTLFLVISTVALWRSTERLASIASDQSEDIRESLAIAERSANAAKKAADAASIQATAAISVEQPIIFAGNIAVNPLNTGFAIYSTGLPEYPIASIRFHNYGRTPAEILGYSIVPKIIKRLPEVRGDPDIFQVAPGTIIKPDDWLSFPYIFQWSEAERRGIVESETRLWIYGIIAYKDFLDNRHEEASALWPSLEKTTS